jgi:hypothetical protein
VIQISRSPQAVWTRLEPTSSTAGTFKYLLVVRAAPVTPSHSRHLLSRISIHDTRPHGRQAVGRTGRLRARPAPTLEAQLAAMGMARRVHHRRISEDVVEGVVE